MKGFGCLKESTLKHVFYLNSNLQKNQCIRDNRNKTTLKNRNFI